MVWNIFRHYSSLASEIEPLPIRVTQHHFPNMKHLGDITQINGAEIEPVDIITFGSPCTRLSVAGRHDGFDITFECQGTKDEPHKIYTNNIRATDKYQYTYKDSCQICGKELIKTNESALFFHAIRIISEMREATNGNYPRFIVWENVPGAYSSNKGEDFRAVLEEISQTEIPMPPSGKWATAGMVRTERADVAWRTLNAQHWGVPQRRKRIFLVADFAGQCASEILFIEEGLRGHFAESREAREEAAAAVGDGIKESVYNWGDGDRLGGWIEREDRIFAFQSDKKRSTAQEHIYHKPNGIADSLTQQKQHVIGAIGFDNQTGQSEGIEVSPAIRSESHGSLPCVATRGIIPFDTAQITSPQNRSNPKPNDPCHFLVGYGEYAADKIAPPIRTNGGDCGGGSDVLVTKLYDMSHGDEVMRPVQEGLAPTLNSRMGTGGNQVPVMMAYGPRGQHDVAHCLRAEPSKADKPSSTTYVIQNAKRYAVRRLTPIECLRLQGFPDDWLDIEGASDAARYKAIGNSVAIPCLDYIFSGITAVLQSKEEAYARQ